MCDAWAKIAARCGFEGERRPVGALFKDSRLADVVCNLCASLEDERSALSVASALSLVESLVDVGFEFLTPLCVRCLISSCCRGMMSFGSSESASSAMRVVSSLMRRIETGVTEECLVEVAWGLRPVVCCAVHAALDKSDHDAVSHENLVKAACDMIVAINASRSKAACIPLQPVFAMYSVAALDALWDVMPATPAAQLSPEAARRVCTPLFGVDLKLRGSEPILQQAWSALDELVKSHLMDLDPYKKRVTSDDARVLVMAAGRFSRYWATLPLGHVAKHMALVVGGPNVTDAPTVSAVLRCCLIGIHVSIMACQRDAANVLPALMCATSAESAIMAAAVNALVHVVKRTADARCRDIALDCLTLISPYMGSIGAHADLYSGVAVPLYKTPWSHSVIGAYPLSPLDAANDAASGDVPSSPVKFAHARVYVLLAEVLRADFGTAMKQALDVGRALGRPHSDLKLPLRCAQCVAA